MGKDPVSVFPDFNSDNTIFLPASSDTTKNDVSPFFFFFLFLGNF